MSNTGRQYPFARTTHSNIVKFDQPLAYIGSNQVATITDVTSNIVLTASDTDRQVGGGEIRLYRGDGSHSVDVSDFALTGPGTFDNTNGAINMLCLVWNGYQYIAIWTQPGTGGTGGGAGDTTPPVITGIVATDAHTISVSFDESVSGSTGFTFKQNGTPVTIASHTSPTSTVITYTITETLLNTDTLTADYAPGDIVNGASLPLASVTGHSITNSISGSTDADATTYINALTTAGETVSGGRQTALHTAFIALKSAGIWAKIKEAYILGWSSYAASRIGIKGAFNFTITGGTWAFSTSTGATPDNGTLAFTGIVPSDQLSQNSSHIGIWPLNSSQVNTYDGLIGAIGGGNYLQIMTSAGNVYADVNGGQTLSGALALAASFDIANRVASGTVKVFRNGSVALTVSDSSTGLPTSFDIALGGSNAAYYSNRPVFFATIGDGLTDGEAADYYSIMNDLKTSFGI